MDRKRELELRKMLEDRLREVAGEITQKLRDVRTNGAEKPHRRPFKDEIGGGIDVQLEVQEDIEIVLIQMKADILIRIAEALGRLDHDAYGLCSKCGEEIAENRLRALPFAVRCKDCEEAREFAEQRKRSLSRRRSLGPLFVSSAD